MTASFVLLCLGLVASALAYNVTSQLSVSGISAGGFVAVQYHVAFSSEVSGAAIFAGGPYYCAQGSEITALTACTVEPSQINVGTLESATKSFATSGAIDAVSGLRGTATRGCVCPFGFCC